MTIIEQIKAEIERMKKEQLTRNSIGVITGTGVFVDVNELLSFLSTLESEKPNNHEGLDEAAKEDAFNNAEDSNEYMAHLAGFKAGAEWQKEQMMKEAVEGEYDCQYMTPAVFLDKYLDGIKDGDKVRIIIVKED